MGVSTTPVGLAESRAEWNEMKSSLRREEGAANDGIREADRLRGERNEYPGMIKS